MIKMEKVDIWGVMDVDRIEVWGFEHAIRGMRNPKNSWKRSDSGYGLDGEDEDIFVFGKKDLELARKLFHAGTEHRKFMRQIFVSMDILAPRYWWTEYDTYKIGTVANSCSTMHKITAKEFTKNDFACGSLETDEDLEEFEKDIYMLNMYRDLYLKTKDKRYWYKIIQKLPQSYLQKRTVTFNYEVAATIIRQRSGHKLNEWNTFVDILQKNLPYLAEIIENKKEDEK